MDSDLSDMERVSVCASLILELRKSQLVKTITMERWFKELFEWSGDALVDEAKDITRFLIRTTQNPVLLHGDLHHYNILADGSGWKVIDPKGIVGDRSFEIVGYIRNPLEGPHNPEIMSARLSRFGELLGDDPYRLWGWAFAETLQSSLQDGPSNFVGSMREAAEAIYAVRPG
jgi:streptomycin 6-kinase